jgi:DNA polymerase-3 subunit beta
MAFLRVKKLEEFEMSVLLEQEHEEGTSEIISKEMSFNVEHDVLMNALLLCAKVVPRSGSIPILQCVKFDLNGNTLFITAMDTAQSVLQMLVVENVGKVNGSYLFPAKEGIELVKRLPHGSLTFNKKDSTVYITYGERGKANLKVLSSEEYPELPKMESGDIISVPIEVMRKGALASRFSLADEKTPALNGIHVYNHDGKVGFVATDRHRIYRYTSDVQIENQETFMDALVNATNFRQIVDSLKDTKTVDLLITRSYLVLRDKSIIYFGRLIDATFPDTSRIFNRMEIGTSVTLSRGELDDTLNRALSLDATNNRVTMEVNEEGIFVLHAESENSELCEQFTNAKIGIDFPHIKFNGRYLRDALLIGDRECKNVLLRVSECKMPAFLFMDGDPSVVVVVNPVM